jgi:hypothetical protein
MNTMKESYEKATIEIVRFDYGMDIITLSGDTPLPETGE